MTFITNVLLYIWNLSALASRCKEKLAVCGYRRFEPLTCFAFNHFCRILWMHFGGNCYIFWCFKTVVVIRILNPFIIINIATCPYTTFSMIDFVQKFEYNEQESKFIIQQTLQQLRLHYLLGKYFFHGPPVSFPLFCLPFTASLTSSGSAVWPAGWRNVYRKRTSSLPVRTWCQTTSSGSPSGSWGRWPSLGTSWSSSGGSGMTGTAR